MPANLRVMHRNLQAMGLCFFQIGQPKLISTSNTSFFCFQDCLRALPVQCLDGNAKIAPPYAALYIVVQASPASSSSPPSQSACWQKLAKNNSALWIFKLVSSNVAQMAYKRVERATEMGQDQAAWHCHMDLCA
eukprot:1160360-Pelagomonas_calceolata.AAC.3